MNLAGRAVLVALALALTVFAAPAAEAATPTVDGEGESCVANSGLVLYKSWTVGIEDVELSTVGTSDGAWVCLETAAAGALRVIVPGAEAASRYDDQHEACLAESGQILYSSTAAVIGRTRVSMHGSATETWVCFESAAYDGRVIMPVPDSGVRQDQDRTACVDNGGLVLYSSVAVGIGRTRVSTWSDGSQAWVCFESLAIGHRVMVPTAGSGLRWDTDHEACMANSGTLMYSMTAAVVGRTRLSRWSSPSETWVCVETPAYDVRVIVPAR